MPIVHYGGHDTYPRVHEREIAARIKELVVRMEARRELEEKAWQRADTLQGSVDVVPQEVSKDTETQTYLCALHEALLARRETIVEMKTYMKYWFNRVTSSFTNPSTLLLVIYRLSLGRQNAPLRRSRAC